MVVVSKYQVGEMLLLKLMAERSYLKDKMAQFEYKYKLNLEAFELQMNQAANENFQMWDDLIEWQAYAKLTQKVASQIIEVRDGAIKMVD
jgi:hypothetical protein